MAEYDKIIVAHPAMQHSFHTAAALKNQGMLFRYITCVYDRKGSLTHWLVRFLKGDFKVKMQAHRSDKLEDGEILQFCEFLSLVLLALRRIDKKKRFVDPLYQRIVRRFNRKVAAYAKVVHADAVILYDTLALEGLNQIKKETGTVCILDMSAPEANFMDAIFRADLEKWGSRSEVLKAELESPVYQKRLGDAAQEIENADYFLAASTFTAESLHAAGVNDDRIIVCRYGRSGRSVADCTQHESPLEGGNKNKPLRCVFIGNVTQKKGVYSIFHMIRERDCSGFAFTFIGAYHPDDSYIKEMSDCCEFTGHLPKNKVLQRLSESDVLVFPTLCDGYGFVVLEALEAGIPVICSSHAGAKDLILDGKNGYLIEAGSEEQLYDRLMLLHRDRNLLERMKEEAPPSVLECTWEEYQKALTDGINRCFSKEDRKRIQQKE